MPSSHIRTYKFIVLSPLPGSGSGAGGRAAGEMESKDMSAGDIGIDLGTASVLVYVKGKGIVLCEPSVVAVDKSTGKILAIGEDAQKMLGRTPGNIIAVRPLRDGVISDYEMTEKMIKEFIHKVLGFRLFKPNVVICGPAFNYPDYGEMCARVAADINATTDSRAFAAMAQENSDVISRYKDQVMIVKTPKKGGLGLNDSLKNICRVAAAMAADSGDLEKLKAEVCF